MAAHGLDDLPGIRTAIAAIERHHPESAIAVARAATLRLFCFTRCFTFFGKFVGHHLRRVVRLQIVHPVLHLAQQ